MRQYLTLKPSTIEGIGVFTSTPLVKGELADLFTPEDGTFVPKPQPEEELIMLNRYSIETPTGWHRPLDWRRMSIGWYLNHSDTPNLTPDADSINYYAARDIAAGEELTIDYDTLDAEIDNKPV